MVNGKIILGTLSIIVALVTFFELLGDLRSEVDGFPIIATFFVVAFASIGITAVRSGLTQKRKTS